MLFCCCCLVLFTFELLNSKFNTFGLMFLTKVARRLYELRPTGESGVDHAVACF